MGQITLMVVEDEVVELVALVVLLLDLPIQERAEGIPLHKTVEQVVDLVWLPDELTLNCGEHDLVTFDLTESVRDRDCCLIGHVGIPSVELSVYR